MNLVASTSSHTSMDFKILSCFHFLEQWAILPVQKCFRIGPWLRVYAKAIVPSYNDYIARFGIKTYKGEEDLSFCVSPALIFPSCADRKPANTAPYVNPLICYGLYIFSWFVRIIFRNWEYLCARYDWSSTAVCTSQHSLFLWS